MANFVLIEECEHYDDASSRAKELAVAYQEQIGIRRCSDWWAVLVSPAVFSAEEKELAEFSKLCFAIDCACTAHSDNEKGEISSDPRWCEDENLHMKPEYPESHMSESEWQRELKRHHVEDEDEDSP